MKTDATEARRLLAKAAKLSKAASVEELDTCLTTLRSAMKALEDAEKLILTIPSVPIFRAPADDYEVSAEFEAPEV